MALNLPNGSIFSVASTYGSALTVSAATNANPCVMTSTAHGLANGDIVEVTSGWLGINDRVLRVAGVATNTFQLEGIDTTSTTRYPAGAGVGSVRKITAWAQLSQVIGSDTTGGGQNYAEAVFLEDGVQRRKPTYKDAKTLELSLADDPTLAFYTTLRTADIDGLVRALRLSLASGGSVYYNAYVSFDDEPTLAANNFMTVKATFAQVAKLNRYAT